MVTEATTKMVVSCAPMSSSARPLRLRAGDVRQRLDGLGADPRLSGTGGDPGRDHHRLQRRRTRAAFIATRQFGPIGWTSPLTPPSARGRRRAASRSSGSSVRPAPDRAPRPLALRRGDAASRAADLADAVACGTTTTPSASPTSRSPLATARRPPRPASPPCPGRCAHSCSRSRLGRTPAGRPSRSLPVAHHAVGDQSRPPPWLRAMPDARSPAHPGPAKLSAGRRRPSPGEASDTGGPSRRDCRWGRTSRSAPCPTKRPGASGLIPHPSPRDRSSRRSSQPVGAPRNGSQQVGCWRGG